MTHPNAAPIKNVPPAAEIGRRRYATHQEYFEANRVRSRERQQRLEAVYRRVTRLARARRVAVEALLDQLEAS